MLYVGRNLIRWGLSHSKPPTLENKQLHDTIYERGHGAGKYCQVPASVCCRGSQIASFECGAVKKQDKELAIGQGTRPT